jgi:hypothetical protein
MGTREVDFVFLADAADGANDPVVPVVETQASRLEKTGILRALLQHPDLGRAYLAATNLRDRANIQVEALGRAPSAELTRSGARLISALEGSATVTFSSLWVHLRAVPAEEVSSLQRALMMGQEGNVLAAVYGGRARGVLVPMVAGAIAPYGLGAGVTEVVDPRVTSTHVAIVSAPALPNRQGAQISRSLHKALTKMLSLPEQPLFRVLYFSTEPSTEHDRYGWASAVEKPFRRFLVGSGFFKCTASSGEFAPQTSAFVVFGWRQPVFSAAVEHLTRKLVALGWVPALRTMTVDAPERVEDTVSSGVLGEADEVLVEALAVVNVLEDLGCTSEVSAQMRRDLRSRLPDRMHDTLESIIYESISRHERDLFAPDSELSRRHAETNIWAGHDDQWSFLHSVVHAITCPHPASPRLASLAPGTSQDLSPRTQGVVRHVRLDSAQFLACFGEDWDARPMGTALHTDPVALDPPSATSSTARRWTEPRASFSTASVPIAGRRASRLSGAASTCATRPRRRCASQWPRGIKVGLWSLSSS